MEMYGGVLIKLYVMESDIATMGMTWKGNKTLIDSVGKPDIDAAIKIVWEKILALML